MCGCEAKSPYFRENFSYPAIQRFPGLLPDGAFPEKAASSPAQNDLLFNPFGSWSGVERDDLGDP